ncbi:MAG: putative RNA methyltransferase [Leptospiraceae bacterium]|nr:MAG: putative RNA methyltransferase [Leptospiraceae bacterium]
MTDPVRTIKWVQNGFTLTYFNNKPFFIHGALPDEIIHFEIIKENKHHGFGIVKKIIQKNPLRKKIDCPIFPLCGGCSYRHIDYKEEIALKIELLKEFSEIKPYLETGQFDYYFSPEYKYRNQVKIHYLNQKYGFFRLYSNIIVPFSEEGCYNLPEKLNEYIKKQNNPSNKLKEKKIFYINNNIIENQTFNIKLMPEVEWEISTDCFLQTNRFLLREWLDWIKNKVLLLTQKSKVNVLELFCGTGIISSYFLNYLNSIEGYESNSISLKFAKLNYKKYHIKNQFIYKDLYSNGVNIKNNQYDIIIINPPRKGIGKKLIQSLENCNIPMIYSSCNPATFNRDIQILKKTGYKIKHFAIFDFFPRTYHVEIVATLVKNKC